MPWVERRAREEKHTRGSWFFTWVLAAEGESRRVAAVAPGQSLPPARGSRLMADRF